MSDDRDLLAAEYVLGTLPADERAVAAALRGTDPAFDEKVVAWTRHLSGLDNGIAPAAPSDAVWQEVLRRLPAHAASAVPRSAEVLVLRRSRARWRTAAVGAGALAAGFAAFVAQREVAREPARPGNTFLAAVNRGGDMPALIVRVDLAAHAVTVRPIQADPPPGKSLELWFVANGRAPRSMGVVGQDRATMPMPEMPGQDGRINGSTFAVSVEPTGGSPTGAPTGPVVYKGTLFPE